MNEQVKRKLVVNGQTLDATPVTVMEAKEPWAEYMLMDGSLVKTKSVCIEMLRIDGVFEPDGTPMYYIKSQPVLGVSAPESLRRQP